MSTLLWIIILISLYRDHFKRWVDIIIIIIYKKIPFCLCFFTIIAFHVRIYLNYVSDCSSHSSFSYQGKMWECLIVNAPQKCHFSTSHFMIITFQHNRRNEIISHLLIVTPLQYFRPLYQIRAWIDLLMRYVNLLIAHHKSGAVNLPKDKK